MGCNDSCTTRNRRLARGNDNQKAAGSSRAKSQAILLVVLVVLLFLQNARATLIPAMAIIISLVGTFAFMLVAGFTLNLITLFALVLTRVLKTSEVRMKYDSDVNYLQVLLARQSLLDAKLALHANRFTLVEATIQLYKALGGGNE